MKEIRTILQHYNLLKDEKKRCALATVVGVEGSSYRRTGARMLVSETGEWVGGISGGCLEGDTLRKAKQSILQNKPILLRYDTTQDDPFQVGVGLGCNGIIDVLIKPIDCQNESNPIAILSKIPISRDPHIVLTLIGTSEQGLGMSLGDSFIIKSIECLDLIGRLETYKSKLRKSIEYSFMTRQSTRIKLGVSDDKPEIFFLEYIAPAIHLGIHGGSYDVYPLAKFAHELGWEVSVFCNPQKVHKSILDHCNRILTSSELLKVDDFTVAVLMSHDFISDKRKLTEYLKTDIAYIGILGPKKRFDKMNAELSAEGFDLTSKDLMRIFSPVGLDTGATIPEEIAVSILAEIRSFLSKRTGGYLRERNAPIYSQ